jgi:hypothetical protein
MIGETLIVGIFNGARDTTSRGSHQKGGLPLFTKRPWQRRPESNCKGEENIVLDASLSSNLFSVFQALKRYNVLNEKLFVLE